MSFDATRRRSACLSPSSVACTASDPATDSVARRQSDEELLALCQCNDDHALATLFGRYSRLVLTIGFRTLRDPAEAEYLVQDVFLLIQE
jgi:hypothetical protein